MEATLKVTYTKRSTSRFEPELDDLVEHLRRWAGADVEVEVVESVDDSVYVRVDSLAKGEKFAMDGRILRVVATRDARRGRQVEAIEQQFGSTYAFRDPSVTQRNGGFSYARLVRRMP